MRTRELLTGVACAAIAVGLGPTNSKAATLDDVMRRLDALERSNAQLAKENADLRRQVKAIGAAKGGAAAAAVGEPSKGNPVLHGAPAPSPAPAPPAGGLSVGGMVVKAGPAGPIIDNTTVTIYGHADVSGDVFNPSVFDQGTKFGVSSNGSYFGIRARHNLAPYGWDGFAVVAQFEEQVDVAAAPTERASFGTRDSYLGMETPWGAIKAGKSDSPYKKATAAFDPFANTLGDYNSIMGNTGGDNRAEFDWRMNNAIWYESPIWYGLQFSAMYAAGQNYAPDNSDYAYGSLFQCTGAAARGSGSNFPGTGGAVPGNIGGNGCTDGSYGDAVSVALTYKNGPWTAIAAYELHEGVNRHGDDGLQPGLVAPVFLFNGEQVFTGVHNEWAVKAGGGYRFDLPWGPLQTYAYYEWLRRENADPAFNERQRDGVFASLTQYVGPWSFSASFAHAFRTPDCSATPTCVSGNPAMLSFNDPAVAQAATLQGNQVGNSATQWAIGTRYRFSNWASWYLVGAQLTQSAGAHYCLGASGHGYQVCSRDQFNDTIGGATIRAATTGLTFDF